MGKQNDVKESQLVSDVISGIARRGTVTAHDVAIFLCLRRSRLFSKAISRPARPPSRRKYAFLSEANEDLKTNLAVHGILKH